MLAPFRYSARAKNQTPPRGFPCPKGVNGAAPTYSTPLRLCRRNQHPISFLITKNQPECHYSIGVLTSPRTDSAGMRESKGLPGEAAKATDTSARGRGDSGGSGRPASEGRYSIALPLKR